MTMMKAMTLSNDFGDGSGANDYNNVDGVEPFTSGQQDGRGGHLPPAWPPCSPNYPPRWPMGERSSRQGRTPSLTRRPAVGAGRSGGTAEGGAAAGWSAVSLGWTRDVVRADTGTLFTGTSARRDGNHALQAPCSGP